MCLIFDGPKVLQDKINQQNVMDVKVKVMAVVKGITGPMSKAANPAIQREQLPGD